MVVFSCLICVCVCVAIEEGLSLFVGPGGSTALGSQHTRWVCIMQLRAVGVTHKAFTTIVETLKTKIKF